MTGNTIRFVALVVDVDLRARTYGPYPTESAAQDLATTIGFTDTDVIGARVLPIADPDLPISAWWAEVARPAPHRILTNLTGHFEPGAPALVLLADPARELLAAVGVFDGDSTARAWQDTADRPAGLKPHLVTPTAGPQPHPDQPATPHVILIDEAGATTCYGPWPDGLHATAWVHHLGVADRAGITVTLVEVVVPFDLTGAAPAHTPPVAAPGATSIVRLWDGDIGGAVGLFTDETAAQAWLDDQAPHLDANLAVLTVTDPGRYPAT